MTETDRQKDNRKEHDSRTIKQPNSCGAFSMVSLIEKKLSELQVYTTLLH